MWGVKQNIKFDGIDVNLKFSLSGGEHHLGYQQEIDNLTEITKHELINPVIDGEIRRFGYYPHGNKTYLSFYFYSDYLKNYGRSFTNAGFSTEEISKNSSNMLNSFFIMELYDTYDPYTQTKISTNYLTKVLTTGYNNEPRYLVSAPSNNQFNDLFLPVSFLEANYGVSIITGYTRFSFYNAKTGRISLFYNSGNTLMLTPEKLYFKISINPLTKTWMFDNTNPTAVEILPTNAYAERINNTINNTENKKQNYPVGSIFNPNTGTYDVE